MSSYGTNDETMALLDDANNMVGESQHMGAAVMDMMGDQRHVLERSHQKTKDTFETSKAANKALKDLQFRIWKEKIALWVVMLGLLAGICVTVYYMAKNGGKL